MQWSAAHAYTAIAAATLTIALTAISFGDQIGRGFMLITGWLWIALFMVGFTLWSAVGDGPSERKFERGLFVVSLGIRAIAVVGVYWLFRSTLGSAFEPYASDSVAYHNSAIKLAEQFRQFNFDIGTALPGGNVSNLGYVMFLGFIYAFTGNSIVVARLIQAVLGALTTVILYRAVRDAWSARVGRTAAIICALYPYLIYYSGLHLKETVFVLLVSIIFRQCVKITTGQSQGWGSVALLVGSLGCLFLFRTFVAVLMMVAVVVHLILNARHKRKFKSVPWLAALVTAAIAFAVIAAQPRVRSEVVGLWLMSRGQLGRELEDKENKIDSEIDLGLATNVMFLGTATIGPLPSMTGITRQENSLIQYSFAWIRLAFTLFAFAGLFMALRKRAYQLSIMLMFLLGYIVVLSASGLSTSHRFQLPTVPVWIALTAVGLHAPWSRKNVYFAWTMSLMALTAVVLYWNYFKLAVRGM